MNIEFFIARRMVHNSGGKSSISSPIIKIAISAIALGVVMILIAIATGRGLQERIRQKIASLNGHIQIFNYDTNRSEVSVAPISMEEDFYTDPQFFNRGGQKVVHIQAVITKGGIIRTEKTFEGIIAKGVGKDFDPQYMQGYLKAGKLPNFASDSISNEVLISEYLANRLELSVGGTCNTLFLREDNMGIPNQRNFTIAGIYSSGFQQFDATYILVDIRQLQKINKWSAQQAGLFEVYIKDFDQMEPTGAYIYDHIPAEYDSQTIAQKYPTIFEWFHTFDLNILIIISIMVIVGGVNMITAILVLILERTPMIGMLKALGATSWSIRKIFLYNAAYLIGLGLFWGNLIGLGLLFVQYYLRH
ncbi:MAG: ABC transporter permease [Capnocytophaga granulosa]